MAQRKRKQAAGDPVTKIRSQVALAILVAKDAVDNLLEYLEVQSSMARIAVRDCEEELDRMERTLDDEIPMAMVLVDERTARELIACLRFITDLERIGDLMWGALKRLDEATSDLKTKDKDQLREMLILLSQMIDSTHVAFTSEDTALAREIIALDKRMDGIHRQLLTSHLKPNSAKMSRVEVIFFSQALERAGDHVTNLGEELIHLAEERSIRHQRRRTADD